MTQLSPYRPIDGLRVFSACLLSLLILSAPMAPLAASVNRINASRADDVAGKLAKRAGKKVEVRERLERTPLAAPPAVTIVSATLTDSIVDTAPANGRADPGSIITYTATILNSGGTDATGVSFMDTISPYTTLIVGATKVSPLAFADAYGATVDTPLVVAASGVLANDTGTPAPTAVAQVGQPTNQGGTITLNTNGGFTYNPASGFVGTDTFTYSVTNGQLPNDTATVTINVTASCPTITVTNPATTTGTVNAAFSQTFTQTGGVGTTTFSINTGTLPTGLTLSTAGVLSGTPTQSGSFPITVKATDSNGCTGTGPTYNLAIACQTITVTNPGTTTGTVNAAFSQTFTQTGAVGTATFTTASTLPTGLSLSTAGVLSGTPTQSGSFPIVVTVTDSNGCTGTGSTYNLTIGCQTITVTNPATTTGTVGAAFSQTFTQTGAQGTATFTTASTLPTGLSLSTAGVLSGTPTQTGSFPIVVTVTDSNGCTGTGSTYTLVIGCQTITVTKPVTTTGTVDAPFSQTFTQTGAQGTATFTTASTLPAGLTLSTAGVLSGTPTQNGSFPIVVTVTDSNGCTGTSSTYNLTIGCQTITVTNPVNTAGTVDTPFSETFTQTGAHVSATFTLNSGSLPAGLTLSTAGVLSGTPTVPGSFPITVKVTDANSCFGVSATYTLVIGCQTITVTNPGVTTGTVDSAFSQNFTQSGAHGTATFTLNSGSLPSGLTLASNGTLSGTPGQPGSFPITVKVTDSNGCTGVGATYTLVISCQTITVTNPGVTTGTVDTAFSQTFTQSGVGTHTPATFTTASTLPGGLTLSSAGVLSGTPSQPGTFPIVVTVTDANGCTGTGSTYTLVIACQTITVTNPATTAAVYNTAFNQTFTGTNLSHTPLSWTVETGTLPTGLTLNSSNGVLSGTPTVTGTFPITVKVTDTNGCNGTGSTYNLTVAPQAITDSYSGLVDNTQFVVTGGTTSTPATPTVVTNGAVTFRLTNNDLPTGGITLTTGTFGTTQGRKRYHTRGRHVHLHPAGALRIVGHHQRFLYLYNFE